MPCSVAEPMPVETSRASLLSVEKLTLQYQTGREIVTAVRSVTFQAAASDRLLLLGPSGCGKSTLLKAIGGFVKPAGGRIRLGQRDIRGPGPDRGFVFQEFEQLLPWKTVLENVIFALTASGKQPRAEAEATAHHYLAKVGLGKFARSFPHTLSGGMKQRVAIARCLAMKPEIILMDEPFAALDALTRRRMQQELLELWNESRFTLLFVTHSIAEAVAVGSRILLFSSHPGQLDAEFTVPADAGAQAELQEHIQSLLFAPTL